MKRKNPHVPIRDRQFNIRLTKEEHDEFQSHAWGLKLRLSHWARLAMDEKLAKERESK